ncbi:MAG: DUF4338 domain-containing protein [Boseongicola sp. SB0673_bin_14]|nr:DUF4338 domain-containing protein [Boseongicola sp. SB0667_bin_21]MYI70787.1 DUF4338 domain-containing protein [Boseongicola sp. SB0673_bin_14]
MSARKGHGQLSAHRPRRAAGMHPRALRMLSRFRRRLTGNRSRTPVLMETFVEVPRFTGAVYKASGWIRVGTTLGRGKYDRKNECAKPRKDIWLCQLRKDWKRTLNR